MSLDEVLVRKKLKELKAKFPGMDIDQVERELFPLQGDVHVKVGKKKKDDE
jgi:hypothetical protein